jgi:hypothetical protein
MLTLGRALAVPEEVQAADEVALARAPRVLHRGVQLPGDPELGKQVAVVHDLVHRLQAHGMDLVASLLHTAHTLRRHLVRSRLVPVRLGHALEADHHVTKRSRKG